MRVLPADQFRFVADDVANHGFGYARTLQPRGRIVAQEANEKARRKIQENFDLRVNPLVAEWNAGADDAGEVRTLLIEPAIQDIKFVNATARVWAGAMAGSSAVVLRMKLTDAATGEEVAHPEFYQRAAAMGGAWTFGSTDNNMLVRITELPAQYLRANYAEAVGGPTGKREE